MFVSVLSLISKHFSLSHLSDDISIWSRKHWDLADERLFDGLHIGHLGVLSLPELSKHLACSKTPSHIYCPIRKKHALYFNLHLLSHTAQLFLIAKFAVANL